MTLARSLQAQAAERPDERALVYLTAGETDRTETFRELHEEARQVAFWLLRNGLAPGDRVVIALSRLPDVVHAFWGCQYLGVVPSLTPYPGDFKDPTTLVERLGTQVGPLGIDAVITDDVLQPTLALALGNAARTLSLCRLERKDTEIRSALPDAPVDEEAIAHIQLSSGTTGAPRAIPLRHRMVLAHIEERIAQYRMTRDDVVVSWLPLHHDMGLVGTLLTPVHLGITSVLMSASEWVRNPRILFAAVHRFRGTIVSMPNFAFVHSVRAVQTEGAEPLDLRSIRVLVNGAEPIREEDQERFARHFSRWGLDPSSLAAGYGMAETVLGVTLTPLGRRPRADWVDAEILRAESRAQPAEPGAATAQAIVSCGAPFRSCEIRVADPAGVRLPDRHVGEVTVRAPWMFDGYLGGRVEGDGLAEGWFRTGDLGYVAEGELFVVGRLKDLIIAGGRNIQPAEIESISGEVPGVRPGRVVAFGVAVPSLGTETAVVVCELREVGPSAEPKAVSRQIRRRVRERLGLTLGHVEVVEPGWILKTTSGKLARPANREKYVALSSSRVAPPCADGVEERLVQIWEEVLGVGPVLLHDDFFALGGTSLAALQLVKRIEEVFGRSVSPSTLLESSTIAEMGQVLRGAKDRARPEIVRLQPLGSRPALFLMHTLAGNLLRYAPLLAHLPLDLPVHGVQSPGLCGKARTHRTMSEMASDYASRIRAVRPEGPYHLAGFSYGGSLAFAVATALLESGHEVGTLALFDTGGRSRTPLRRLAGYVIGELRQGLLHELRRSARRLVGSHLSRPPERSGSLALGGDARARIKRENRSVLRGYVPHPIPVPITYFRAHDTDLRGVDYWRRQTTRDLHVVEVPGTHGTMLSGPSAAVVAEHLDRALRQAAL